MTDAERIEKLVHSSRNAAQMLHSVDRLLERASKALDEGDVQRGKEMVDTIRESLPRAVAALKDGETAGD